MQSCLIAIAVAVCLVCVAAPPCRAASFWQNPDPVTIQLKWTHQFQFAGYYAALERGYYADEGFEVTLREGGPETDSIVTLSDGKADFAIATPAVLIDRALGKPVVAVAAIFQHSPIVLLTRKDSGLETIEALGGRKVMLKSAERMRHSEILAMLRQADPTAARPVFLPHSGNLEDLIDGRVDAILAYLSNEPRLLRERGIDINMMRPSQYGIDFYGDILITSQQVVVNNPVKVRAILRATVRGWEYALAHPEEIADLILARYPTAKTRDDLLAEAQVMRGLILPDLIAIGSMNRQRWQHIGDVFASLEMLPPDWTLDHFLFQEIEEERSSRVGLWIKIGALAGLVVLGLALLLAVFAVRLRAQVILRSRELSESEQQFRAIFDHVNDGIFLQDPATGAIVAFNQRLSEMFGYSRDEMSGLTIAHLGQSNLSNWLAKAKGSHPRLFEWKAQSKDGRPLWLEVSLREARIGDHTRLVVVARDISSRREVEAQLRQTIEDLVSSNSDLERFAYVSSHDLQTPLRNVVSYAQLLDRRYRGRLDDDADEFIGFIVDNTRHMSELINDLLEYTKVARQTRTLVELDPRRALNQAVAALRQEIDRLGATLTIDPLPPVMGDEGQLVSLFQNLIANALKYRSADRAPHIRIEPIAHQREDQCCIAVHDNGIGIEPQYFGKIFEMFQRLHPEQKGEGGGTGIGLALCQRIVNHLGGEIWVASTPGQGSSFLFTLSLAENTATPSEQKPPQPLESLSPCDGEK